MSHASTQWAVNLFQNAIPAVPSNYGYGGVVASYNLFDFGKRERAVKEARAKVEMAEIVVKMTKDKVAVEVKKSYFELVSFVTENPAFAMAFNPQL